MLTLWIVFHLCILALIFADLAYTKKTLNSKKALAHSVFWIGLALGFNCFIAYFLGWDAGISFFTAYVVEKSLSIDNLFVFFSIFTFFKIQEKEQKRILFLGIMGALICRIAFILAGVALLEAFSWIYFVFGALLFISAFYLYTRKKGQDLNDTIVMRGIKKLFCVDMGENSPVFFIKKQGKLVCTRLLVALLFIEGSDILFAVDSVPAVLAITTDPFLAYTSNVFAILGLRSLYFLLLNLHKKYHYLEKGIVLILGFMGLKMFLSPFVVISNAICLVVVLCILSVCIWLSLKMIKKRNNE